MYSVDTRGITQEFTGNFVMMQLKPDSLGMSLQEPGHVLLLFWKCKHNEEVLQKALWGPALILPLSALAQPGSVDPCSCALRSEAKHTEASASGAEKGFLQGHARRSAAHAWKAQAPKSFQQSIFKSQKQDRELTVAQILKSLLPNSDWNWRK